VGGVFCYKKSVIFIWQLNKMKLRLVSKILRINLWGTLLFLLNFTITLHIIFKEQDGLTGSNFEKMISDFGMVTFISSVILVLSICQFVGMLRHGNLFEVYVIYPLLIFSWTFLVTTLIFAYHTVDINTYLYGLLPFLHFYQLKKIYNGEVS